jgi:DNA-binding FadR family transcriptional regulator
MKATKNESTVHAAAARLRTLVSTAREGTLLGSEDDLVNRLKVSRATVRQVARLLEREGLLRVRRGINGGYFAARPDLKTVETTVSAYLEMFETDVEDVFAIASALWGEVMRKAAGSGRREGRELVKRFREKVNALPADAAYDEILKLELESRDAIFALINNRYIQLIFQINMAFAQRRLAGPVNKDNAAVDRDLVRAWRGAKLMELQAIADGDSELGMMAARHSRNVWHKQMRKRTGG